MRIILSYHLLLLALIFLAGYALLAQEGRKGLPSLSVPQESRNPKIAAGAEAQEADDSTAAAEMPVDTAVVSRLRIINEDTLLKITLDKGFYYKSWLDSLLRAEEAARKAESPPPPIHLQRLAVFFDILKWMLWILAAVTLGIIIYRLFIGNNALFIRNRKNTLPLPVKEASPPGNEQYRRLLEEAESGRDYRLAVRYSHLLLLCYLSEKKYIVAAAGKTNDQYRNEISKRSPVLGEAFSRLTRSYEYIWYGRYTVNDAQYQTLRQHFRAFHKETLER